MLWGAATGAAVYGGRWWLAAWLAVGGLVAAGGVARSWGVKPAAAAGGLAATVVVPLTAAGTGAPGAGIVLALCLVLGVLVGGLASGRRPLVVTDPVAMSTAAGAALALCAASLVLLDRHSTTLVALVLLLACAHDASRYLVGWGAPSPWEGRMAALAAVGSLTLAVAVIRPSPLTGLYPWALGAIVGGAGLAGRPLVARLEGPRARSARPGRPIGVGPLRRLDTLLLAAPAALLMAVVGGR